MSEDEAKLERAQVLRLAEQLTCGDRNAQYGDPLQDFKRIADIWTILFDRQFKPHEVAMALAALKLSRICHSPGKQDSWVDGAGYFACGWECAVDEAKEVKP